MKTKRAPYFDNQLSRRLSFLRSGAIAVYLLLLGLPLSAQFDTGTISGSVTDPSGAVVPNAKVTVLNQGTSQKIDLQSTASGAFVASALPFGKYLVSASAPGFAAVTSETISLAVGAAVHVDLRLTVSSTTANVVVTGTVSSVNTDNTTVGTTLNSNQVMNLPVNGRDVMDFLEVTPGAVATAGTGFQGSVNGMESSFTGLNTLLDGADATRIDTNGTYNTEGSQEARITRASVDSIQEIDVLSTGYQAEYGRSIGTVVNLVTKSGTNEFHGVLYDYLRNEDLNARNFFETSPQPFKLNQFGGNLGGPIIKDKLFFFANYEGDRQHITTFDPIFETPSAALRAQFVPAMQPILQALPALPANATAVPGTGGDLDFLSVTFPNILREDTGSIKFDYLIGSNDRLAVRYNINDSETDITYGANAGQVEILPLRTQYGRIDETHSFSPTLLNEFGLAVDRFHSLTSSATTLPIFQGFFINLGSLPGPQLYNQLNVNTSYELLESLTKTAGHHTWKFGADIRTVRSNTTLRNNQVFDFASFSDLANDRPFILQTLGFPMIGLNNSNLDFYAQDDWRVRPGLTINFGLRYEYNTVITESHGRLQNFDLVSQSFIPSSEGAYKPDYNNFAPRLGFSWDPFGKGKTVIHGFGGIFYLPMLVGSLNSLSSNIPAFAGETINVFQAPLAYPEPNPPFIPGTQNIQAFDRNSRDTYSAQWLFGVQQEIAKQTVLEVNYVGSKTNHQPAGAAFAGLEVNPLNPLTGTRPYPNFGDERELGAFLQSKYDAMQTQLRHRTGKVDFDVNYTWSHEIDNTLNVFGTFEDPYNYNLDRASGDIDVRNNFSADMVYTLPELRGSNGFIHSLFGGWQASSIFQARSGLPVNIQLESGFFAPPFRPNYVSGQPIYVSNPHYPDSSFNAAAYSVEPDYNQTLTVGNVGRNTARGPAFYQWDLSAMKSFPIGERVRLQFRADLFNLLNHPNFANPNNGLCNSITLPNTSTGTPAVCVADPTFGESASTIGTLVGTGTSRQVQLALKLMF
ncbi:MAG TPA: TonB-dependent receptor [Bryobacteraceae bacterium]|jgi:hypothetical protein|nr:TonB-dependent receptor [Bryobacteraceae bacterium]